jgi:hypothetical protein
VIRALFASAAALAIAAAASPATAAEATDATAAVRFELPDGLTESPEAARAASRSWAGTGRLGVTKFEGGGGAFVDRERGVVIYSLWLVTDEPVKALGAAARGELDALRARPREAGIPDAAVTRWKEDLGPKVATAEIEYRTEELGTRTLARAAVFGDAGGRGHTIVLECVLRDDAPPDARAGCERALATLAPTLPDAQLAALGTVPGAARQPGAGGADPALTLTTTDGGVDGREPILLGGPPPRGGASGSSNLIWVGGGVLVLLAAAMLFWRGRREK